MKQNNKKSSITNLSGFTLVELLVVISIIGILAGIVYANFGDARATARDEARKVALKEVQLAIELYKAQNGRYPEACRGVNSWSGNVPGSFKCSSGTEYIVGLVSDYIQTLPVDVKSSGNSGYIYRTDRNGKNYKLMSHNIVEKDAVTEGEEFFRCPTASSCGGNASTRAKTYAVYSAGAASW